MKREKKYRTQLKAKWKEKKSACVDVLKMDDRVCATTIKKKKQRKLNYMNYLLY